MKEAYLYVFYEYVSFLFFLFFYFSITSFISWRSQSKQTFRYSIWNITKKSQKYNIHADWQYYFTVLYIVLSFVTLIFSQKGLTKHYSSASLELSCRTKYLRGVKKAPTFYIFTRFFLTTSVNKKSFLCLSANIYK